LNLYHLAIEGGIQPYFGRSTESVTIRKILIRSSKPCWRAWPRPPCAPRPALWMCTAC